MFNNVIGSWRCSQKKNLHQVYNLAVLQATDINPKKLWILLACHGVEIIRRQRMRCKMKNNI
jgi:hypothetical protein